MDEEVDMAIEKDRVGQLLGGGGGETLLLADRVYKTDIIID